MYELRHNGQFVKSFASKEEALQFIPSNRIETSVLGDVILIYTNDDLINHSPASYQLIEVH